MPPKAKAATAKIPLKALVIYIHGIRTSTDAADIKRAWDMSLFGVPMGDQSRMAYWGHGLPEIDTPYVGGKRPFAVRAIESLQAAMNPELTIAEEYEVIASMLQDEPGADAMLAMAKRMARDEAEARKRFESERKKQLSGKGPAAKGVGATAFVDFLPAPVRITLSRAMLKVQLLRDVRDYFDPKHPERRQWMRDRFIERLPKATSGIPAASKPQPCVIIAHSMGTVIAYDVLSDPTVWPRLRMQVPLFLTIGSPLGITEVEDLLRDAKGLSTKKRLPFVQQPEIEQWVNVASSLDYVALDKGLNGEYGTSSQKIIDHHVFFLGGGSGFDPHSAEGYLKEHVVRQTVLEATGREIAQEVAPFVLARDVSRGLESGDADQRHSVLLELPDHKAGSALQEMLATIEAIVAASLNPAPPPETKRGAKAVPELTEAEREQAREAAHLDPLKRFVAAKLTRHELEALRQHHVYSESVRKGTSSLGRVWKNSAKRVLISKSIQTVQSFPAQAAYRADGHKINWAVLDTGIDAGHSHFLRPDGSTNIEAVWDCTKRGPIAGYRLDHGQAPTRMPADFRLDLSAAKRAAAWELNLDHAKHAMQDRYGHGTHVAGIIAGRGTWTLPDETEEREFVAMAPKASLHIYKVLKDDGIGDDSYTIKALDHIWELNDRAGSLQIQGINLSLGGSFEADVYGCGHSPICRELRRLWQQGVLIVVACGNEGFQRLMNADGEETPLNLDLTIGDPANLEQCIAVGSVNAEYPHTYGISWFSSRGPTADGRIKPDVVAPGERIWSARSRQMPGASARTKYYQETGTSMAAPHVSGILAAYLSIRREFIGQPDCVKETLLEYCVDLKRDRNFQGAGLVNLIKMLALK